MIQTTHVGSLPFLETTAALDYTFRWDVPVLFTLPKQSSIEYLGLDLLSGLGLHTHSNKSEIILPKNFLQCSQKINPHHLKEFLLFGEKLNKLHKYKVQFPGPVTLYSLLGNRDEICFTDFSQFLLEKFVKCSEELQRHGEIIFVLDEPLLRENILFYEESNYLKVLAETRAEAFIHCCDKIDLSLLSNSLASMHLDIGLYRNTPGVLDLPLKFVGFKLDSGFLPTKTGSAHFVKNSLKYISPACGLGLDKTQDVSSLPEEFHKSFR